MGSHVLFGEVAFCYPSAERAFWFGFADAVEYPGEFFDGGAVVAGALFDGEPCGLGVCW